ncbi:MAG: cytochrome b subunit of the bc complex [Chloroflexi bacterium]|nr:cytochrome b subunit of the bc complex [Chloroflexota bacterium]
MGLKQEQANLPQGQRGSRPGKRELEREKYSKSDETVPFLPHHALTEAVMAYIALILIIVLASLIPAVLEGKADPFNTPAHIKPEWYFMSLYEILKWVPRIVGIIAPGVALLALVFLPFLDRNPNRHPSKRRFAMTMLALVLIGWVGTTLYGFLG